MRRRIDSRVAFAVGATLVLLSAVGCGDGARHPDSTATPSLKALPPAAPQTPTLTAAGDAGFVAGAVSAVSDGAPSSRIPSLPSRSPEDASQRRALPRSPRAADKGVATASATATTPADAGALVTTQPALAASAWDAVIGPMFVVRCSGCHGAEKQKAKMRLDSYDGVMHGGEDGKVIVPGDPSASLMMKRLLLPNDDDDHMPPAKKPQPSRAELDVLRLWIASGATKSVTIDGAGISGDALAAATNELDSARRRTSKTSTSASAPDAGR